MGATNPLKRGLAQRLRFRTVDPAAAPPGVPAAGEAAGRLEILRCDYRPENADFYCWKYGVWYNLMDCCYRHDRRTWSGCAGCGQGHNNLRQNRARYLALRPRKGRPFAR